MTSHFSKTTSAKNYNGPAPCPPSAATAAWTSYLINDHKPAGWSCTDDEGYLPTDDKREERASIRPLFFRRWCDGSGGGADLGLREAGEHLHRVGVDDLDLVGL